MDKQFQKIHKLFLRAEPSAGKMILSQWIDRVIVYSYEHIEVRFFEAEKPSEPAHRTSAQF